MDLNEQSKIIQYSSSTCPQKKKQKRTTKGAVFFLYHFSLKLMLLDYNESQ